MEDFLNFHQYTSLKTSETGFSKKKQRATMDTWDQIDKETVMDHFSGVPFH